MLKIFRIISDYSRTPLIRLIEILINLIEIRIWIFIMWIFFWQIVVTLVYHIKEYLFGEHMYNTQKIVYHNNFHTQN